MRTLTEFYRDEVSEYSPTAPIEDTHKKTVDTLEKATDYLDKYSRGMLDLHSIPEPSRPEFVKALTQLTEEMTTYTTLHFLDGGISDVDMYCCTDRVAMEKTITELATNSAISNRVHGLLLTGLESLRIELRKKSETLKSDAGKMRETCEERRQDIVEKEVQYNFEHDYWIARKEKHSEEKVKHDADQTSQAAASTLKHKEVERVREKEAEEARDMKANAARQGTYGTVAGAVGAVTVTGGCCTALAAVGATVMTGGVVVGGAAIFGVGAVLMTTANAKERTAEGDERVAFIESSRARGSRERATEYRDRARKLAEDAEQMMRRAAQDAAQVKARKAREIFELENEAKRAEQGANDCDYTIQLLSSVLDSLQQFVKAMEMVSQFLSGLASDIDSCLGHVKAGRNNRRHRMNQHFALMQDYIGRVKYRCDSFENFRGIVQSRIDALPGSLRALNAPASSASWIQDHH
ncbi:hypothetical protein M758_3G093000 [Ceratodon purpureus]|nr:hypothetical protein M758_3G093000 [Ceratodon purpureus]